jgi:hypothetical protein
MGIALPDFGLASFESDEWRFSAVCVVVIGVAVVPSYLFYRSTKLKHSLHYEAAIKTAEAKLEQAKNKSSSRARKPPDDPATLH